MKLFRKLILLAAISGCSLSVQGAIPSGYYHFTLGKKKAELKSILSEISSPLTVLDYGSGPGFTWQGFYSADRNTDGTVKDMYSNTVRNFNGYNSVDGMAIEHSFPKSWWGSYENMAYKDLFHLYPADAYTNGIKNNLPLGEVQGSPMYDNGTSKIGMNGFGTDYYGNCFEPADEYKGDFARSYFYISTIYENLAPLWDSPMLFRTVYPAWKPWAVDLLMKWSREDPVSRKEQDRNDSIYTIQGNRNPFIDFPELDSYIWGKDTLNAFTYPEETGAFLVAPRRKFKLDFGVILLNATKSLNFSIEGVNITSPLTLSFLRNSPSLTLSSTNISVADAQTGFNLQVNYLPTVAGTTVDTLLIQGGGLTEITRIPVRGLATSEFIAMEPTELTPVGGTLHWLEDPYATNYTVSLYQGDMKAGNLIISGYLEGDSFDKAIELYNGTGATIDLSNYSLKKQSNGYGEYETSLKLFGTLQNNKTYVIVNSSSTNTELRAKADLLRDTITSFNGNDAVALFRNGVQIDVVGKLNGGADFRWGGEKILKRKAGITHPSSTFKLEEWAEFPFIQLDKIGTHTMNFAPESNFIFKDKSVGITNWLVAENLNPNENYTYSVTSYRSGVVVPSVNTQRLITSGLQTPIAMAATETGSTSFVANWEDVPYATGYYLDVYQLSGRINSETEEFTQVGSNGKPLPTGWTGNASGIYTTTTSSGTNIPSIAFKNDNNIVEWLQTKPFPDIISKLNFMYRYASSGTGSYLKVEAQNQSGWNLIDNIGYVNTSKYYPAYTFSKEKGYTAVKFTYSKVAGNLALDDVTIEHGSVDTVFVIKNKLVTGNQSTVEGLGSNSVYYYRVKANRGNSVSGFSEPVLVSTSSTGNPQLHLHTYHITNTPAGIQISNLKGDESVRLFSVTGSVVMSTTASGSTLTLPVESKGIFILQVAGRGHSESYKIAR